MQTKEQLRQAILDDLTADGNSDDMLLSRLRELASLNNGAQFFYIFAPQGESITDVAAASNSEFKEAARFVRRQSGMGTNYQRDGIFYKNLSDLMLRRPQLGLGFFGICKTVPGMMAALQTRKLACIVVPRITLILIQKRDDKIERIIDLFKDQEDVMRSIFSYHTEKGFTVFTTAIRYIPSAAIKIADFILENSTPEEAEAALTTLTNDGLNPLDIASNVSPELTLELFRKFADHFPQRLKYILLESNRDKTAGCIANLCFKYRDDTTIAKEIIDWCAQDASLISQLITITWRGIPAISPIIRNRAAFNHLIELAEKDERLAKAIYGIKLQNDASLIYVAALLNNGTIGPLLELYRNDIFYNDVRDELLGKHPDMLLEFVKKRMREAADEIITFIEEDVDFTIKMLSATDDKGYNALMVAILNDNIDMAIKLLHLYGDIQNGLHIMLLARSNGHTSVAEMAILKQNRRFLNAFFKEIKNDDTLLALALPLLPFPNMFEVACQHPKTLDLLLTEFKDDNEFISEVLLQPPSRSLLNTAANMRKESVKAVLMCLLGQNDSKLVADVCAAISQHAATVIMRDDELYELFMNLENVAPGLINALKEKEIATDNGASSQTKTLGEIAKDHERSLAVYTPPIIVPGFEAGMGLESSSNLQLVPIHKDNKRTREDEEPEPGPEQAKKKR